MALRSRIVLAAARGRSNQQIASDLDIPEVTVGKWRRSFAAQGLEGLHDAPRSGRPPKHDTAVWQQVQTLACQQPEFQGRWTVRTLARELGLPHSTVHAILNASELQLHRIRTFTFSPDPEFQARSVGEFARRIGGAEQAGERYHHGYPVFPRTSHEPGCLTKLMIRRGTDRFADGLTLAIQTLQMCA